MKSLRLFFFILIPLFSGAQTIKGVIYDAEATIKGAKFVNKTQNILTYSDGKGLFEIQAKLNDTIVVSSYFHHEQSITVTQDYFGQDVVIELKKITNELDEVEVTKISEKKVDTLALSSTTAKQGQIAFKKRVFGSGKNLQPTLDLIGLAKAIGKLFKKKTVEVKVIEVEDLLKLFEKGALFNTVFLRNELNIQETYDYLFFEYCSAQQLSPSLLLKDNEFMLLDELLKHSKAFNILLEEHKKD
ncbi:carboxypeptidase-like regulatory domain-containing protein [uncultured Psychroserpens sp.]|uniref:carboxypeptidase-like regulatory domain-containing protein n=1 Tax=uncultured Psychroserpens sp. TaxID=255436 RepID=UPI0026349EEF|nr:carboxypeptidase-like regulatory domain-containing protein [uncultured Psychroserpens sp.]